MVRIERVFPEDKVILLSVIPLTIRVVLIPFVLNWGTNNIQTAGLTETEIAKRTMDSKLVWLLAYSMPSCKTRPDSTLVVGQVVRDGPDNYGLLIYSKYSIWMAKLTVSGFLKRVTGCMAPPGSHLSALHPLLPHLGPVAVVFRTLAEYPPFDHCWQARPDPGPSCCRSGHVQLITVGTCDVITFATTAVSNIVINGSFARNRGIKKLNK